MSAGVSSVTVCKFLVDALDHAGQHLVAAEFDRRVHAERRGTPARFRASAPGP